MATTKHTKIKLREVNRHLVCRLCRGYYVDATTIAECLHSFCRSCIIKYLEQNSFCPICEVQIHKTKPYLSLRLDKALQDVVYKVVPGLYHDEMRRRREFYAKRQEQILFATPEQCGLEERIIFSPEDSISLSLEYLESDDYESETVSSQSSESGDNPDLLSFPQQLGLIKLKNNDGKTSRRESQDVQENTAFPKRYLQCPAVVNVGHLKKFIRMKHDLTDKMQVSVIHKRVPLPDHYTLMDVAYIYTWKRNSPLRFFYQIYQTKKQKIKVESEITETEDSKTQTEELKSTKATEINEKVNNSEPVKPTEVTTTVKNNIEKSEKIEVKQTVTNNESNSEDSNKVVVKTESEKSVKSVSSDNINGEKKEGFEPGPEMVVQSKNKSEKSKVNSVNTTENKNKADSQKRKSVKVESNEIKKSDVKEKELDDRDRLLLNPISGKLESVPSADQNKTVNGTVTGEEKKENEDCIKKDVSVKGQKKLDSQNSKDSKKSNVNLLKSFRKEKLSLGKDKKIEIKTGKGSSLTITPIPKNDKPAEKETGKLSVGTKTDNKESEYDFDGSSPSKIIPLQEFSKYSKFSKYMAEHRDKWLSKESKNQMSLKDFRKKMKENDAKEDDAFVSSKKKVVPSLYKINSETTKTTERKTPNGKLETENPKETKTNINNDKTKNEVSKEVSNPEVVLTKIDSSLKITKVEAKDGKNSPKPTEEKKPSQVSDSKPGSEQQKTETKPKEVKPENVSPKESLKKNDGEKKESENDGEKTKSNSESAVTEVKSEPLEAMDLSKAETSPKSEKNPLENLIDMASKTETSKGDEKMMEALVSAAQKQSLEPLLKIPQYSQLLKNSMSLGSVSPGKNISSSDISQALQFLEEFRSDMKTLEMKNKLNPNSVLEQFAQKSGNLEPYQQLYQQKIDLIRRLKRQHQITPNESESPPKKQLKLSPVSESKKKIPSSPEQNTKKSPTKEEVNQYKASMDRTLSQIQMLEFENRMLAAQNYKNLPGLIQYYNKTSNTSSGSSSSSSSSSKSNQQKTKSSSHSPNKSPQGSSSSAGNSPLPPSSTDSAFFNNYRTLLNAGLSSEMTYHQMFQSYLNQQEQLNQVNLLQVSTKKKLW